MHSNIMEFIDIEVISLHGYRSYMHVALQSLTFLQFALSLYYV